MKTLKTTNQTFVLSDLIRSTSPVIRMIKTFEEMPRGTKIKITIDAIIDDEEIREIELLADALGYRGYNVEDIYLKKKLFKGLRLALKTITQNESLALKLKYGIDEDRKYKNYEIAKKLNISQTAVSYMIRRAMIKLQDPSRVRVIINPDKYSYLE